MAFTDDFRNEMSQELLEHHDIELLLTTKANVKCFPDRPAHIALMDGENGHVRVLRRSNLKRESDDELTWVFSSGSSGGLKGLVISRKGVMATLPPILDAVGLSRRDCFLLFLPLSNFQQRYLFYGALWYDFDIALTDFMQLFSAIETLHPTILLAPPVFYQMFHAEHLNKPRWQRWLQNASGTLLSAVPSARARRALGRRIFRDFHGKFGHHIRMLITGMAPIRPNVLQLFERMQMPLSEAYGMVEAGVMTFKHGHQGDHRSVGTPVRDVRFSFGEDGEIVVHREILSRCGISNVRKGKTSVPSSHRGQLLRAIKGNWMPQDGLSYGAARKRSSRCLRAKRSIRKSLNVNSTAAPTSPIRSCSWAWPPS